MYTVSLSDNFIEGTVAQSGTDGLMCRLIRSTNSSRGIISEQGILNTGANASTNTATLSIMYILKGIIPSDFSTLISINAMLPNVLCKWQTMDSSGANLWNFSPSSVTSNPCIINTIYTDAVSAGTATWFWLFSVFNNGSCSYLPNQTAAPLQQMFGTVGITGSGADLEIPDTNIVLGKKYAITNLAFKIPTTWSH